MHRRDILKSALGSLAACAGNTTMLGGLGLLNSAQALGSASFNDHKSLVMVFLKGGRRFTGTADPIGLKIVRSVQRFAPASGHASAKPHGIG